MNDEQRRLNDEGRAIWDQKAAFWDELHGDNGNLFHRTLVSPAVERLLALRPDERVLDVGCGSGVLARRMAELGAQVLAVDFSAALLERALARSQPTGHPITYAQLDATDESALAALGEGQFDALTCTMALMDMPVIAPLYRAACRLLRPGGRMVIATAHPAFNSNNPVRMAEMRDDGGDIITVDSLKISAYLDIPPVKGAGAPGEPTPHTYYHRPLHNLFGEAFVAGLLLDGLEEPAFPKDEAVQVAPLRLYRYWQMPMVLTARLRRV
jgi:2-polyprenyl-3-methyl-5-hydroxy-6-metoxy-1,4-benzoquinol methylase